MKVKVTQYFQEANPLAPVLYLQLPAEWGYWKWAGTLQLCWMSNSVLGNISIYSWMRMCRRCAGDSQPPCSKKNKGIPDIHTVSRRGVTSLS